MRTRSPRPANRRRRLRNSSGSKTRTCSRAYCQPAVHSDFTAVSVGQTTNRYGGGGGGGKPGGGGGGGGGPSTGTVIGGSPGIWTTVCPIGGGRPGIAPGGGGGGGGG